MRLCPLEDFVIPTIHSTSKETAHTVHQNDTLFFFLDVLYPFRNTLAL